jgi:uncharacterized protein (DUF4213/DUF364 family)
MTNPWEFYDLLIERSVSEAKIKQVLVGRTWTLCETDRPGLAMSPVSNKRTLSWPGTLAGRNANELAQWVRSWDPFEASIGLATINAQLGHSESLLETATPIHPKGPANLAVFEYFLPQLLNKRVVVLGRYPGLERYATLLDLTVLERVPGADDLPDVACEYLLREADWVFITATSIANKTFPRLAELSRDAVTVLMGPSAPWLEELSEWDVDFLAGVTINEPQALHSTVAEGGGVRIFDSSVQYHVADLSRSEMQWINSGIADLVARREQLKNEMERWYACPGLGRFPNWSKLEQIDRELSLLDLRFKRQWDARFVKEKMLDY